MIQVLDKPLLNGVTPGNEHDGDRGGRGFGRQASRRPGLRTTPCHIIALRAALCITARSRYCLLRWVIRRNPGLTSARLLYAQNLTSLVLWIHALDQRMQSLDCGLAAFDRNE